MSFRLTITEIAPPWLLGTTGSALLRTFGAMIDRQMAQLKEGVLARFPQYAPDDALGYIGRDRNIKRGPSESAANYKLRLGEAIESNRNRGGGRTLLAQLAGHFSGFATPGLRLVGSNGVWQEWDHDTRETTKTSVRTNWDWDGQDHWWWGWVIIDASGGGATFNTDGNTTAGSLPYIADITPSVGDLLVVFVSISDNTDDAPTCTDDNGGTYTLLDSIEYGSGAHRLSVFVRDQLTENADQTFVTISATGTTNTICIEIVAVSGMQKAGADAVRNSGRKENQAAGAMSVVLGGTTLTTNMTLVAVANGSPTTSTVVEPTGWTERRDTRANFPAYNGLEVATRDSGFAGTTISWPDASGNNWAAYGLELDGDSWIQPANTFGDPDGGEFDDGQTFGSTATVEQVQAIQSVVQQWKPANVYAARIIVTFDADLYKSTNVRKPDSADTSNPDGEMGDDSNFNDAACYWLGGGEETSEVIEGSFRPDVDLDPQAWLEGAYDSGNWYDRAVGSNAWQQATGANKPATGLFQSPSFDGTNDYLALVGALSALVHSTNGFSFAFLINADTLAAYTSLTGSETLFCDTSQKLGVILTTSGVKFWIDDGTPSETAFVPIEAGKWILYRGKWDLATGLFLARGRDAFPGGVASGAPSSLAGTPRLGTNHNASAFLDGTLGALVTENRVWTDDEFEGLTSYLEMRFGMRLD